ncbi:RHS repeat-associated core domain-containing protein [Paenarthrobacter sp. Z7-10]|uniref:RHS repeat domain-containing protein n=1 Tax=Paenarthrobacter sp. Z7-10 TaxID=2787635 RepID=UPI0022A9942B|nr:RHS repeat-associated core domain-containing protein [Paenarthrobacter sp. Z7-10]MCZ2405038.1 RHS repeat-associated core domain-containing protein [Paenarthrobacter sp. Z7-10]
MNASLTNPGVNEYRIRFNDSGVVNVYTDDGSNYSLAYSIDANVTNPNTISYTYTNGVLSGTTDTQGRSVSYLYEDTRNLNQPSKITDQSLNRSVTLEYNGGQGRLSKVTDATGITTAFTYTAAGKLSTYTDGRTTATAITYDTANKATTITYGSGTSAQSIWTAAYPSTTTSTLKDPNSKTATYTYNTARQVTSVLDPNGNNVSGVFDKHDNNTTSTDGLGNLTTSAYNTTNNLTSITSPAGAAGGSGGDVSFTYSSTTGDPLSNYQPATATNSEGKTTTVTYDANTHAPSVTTKPGLTGTIKNYYQGDTLGTTCGAKPGSLCRTIDGQGNTTSHGYDSQGNPITLGRPAPLGVITNTFDAAGRVTTTKDGKNQSATYTYDANDRLTQTRYGSSCVAASCVTYTYDANGNVATRTDASGTTTYTYDAQNRATSKTTGTTTTNLAYDGASNILTFVDPTGTVAYKYDGANRLTSLAEPGGSCPATPAFPNTTKCTGFGYDKNNRRTTTTYPNGVKNTTTFDNAGRTTAITATNSSGTVLAKRAYTFTTGGTGKDGALKKTTTTETNAVTTYAYDELNRLTSAVQGSTTETWAYDKNGNRVTATKTGQPTVHSAYNAADQLCWTASSTGSCGTPPTGATNYTYDGNGNTTSGGAGTTNAFNVFDQVTSTTTGGSTTNFAYAGQRNDERTTSGNTNFLNGSLGITTQTTAGATTAFIRDPAGTLISMRTTAGSYYYTTDTLGSVILLTDSTQARAATYAYDSWGNTTTTGTQAPNNPWQYAGGYKDTTTGYTKFGARYYNPALGRFTQTDPSGQEANAYLYAGADPVNSSDPTGLYSWGDFWGGVGGEIISGVGGVVVGAITKTTPAGIIGGLVVGCLGGIVSEAVGNGINGQSTSGGDVAGSCAGGAVTGVLGGVAGNFVRKGLVP